MSNTNKKINKLLNEAYFLNKDHSIEIVNREDFKEKYNDMNHELILLPVDNITYKFKSQEFVIIDKSFCDIDFFELSFDVYIMAYDENDYFGSSGTYKNILFDKSFKFESDNFFDIHRVLHSILLLTLCDNLNIFVSPHDSLDFKFIIKNPSLTIMRKGKIYNPDILYAGQALSKFTIKEFYKALEKAFSKNAKAVPHSIPKSFVVNKKDMSWEYEKYDINKFDSISKKYDSKNWLLSMLSMNCSKLSMDYNGIDSIVFMTYDELLYLSYTDSSGIGAISFQLHDENESINMPKYLMDITSGDAEIYESYRSYIEDMWTRRELICKLVHMEKIIDIINLISSLIDGDISDLLVLTQLTAYLRIDEDRSSWIALSTIGLDENEKLFRYRFIKSISKIINNKEKGLDFDPGILPF